MNRFESLLRRSGLTDQDLEGVPYRLVLVILGRLYATGPWIPPESCEQVLLRYGRTPEEVKDRPHTFLPAEDEVDLGPDPEKAREEILMCQRTVLAKNRRVS